MHGNHTAICACFRTIQHWTFLYGDFPAMVATFPLLVAFAAIPRSDAKV
jgi:hypothetical protein